MKKSLLSILGFALLSLLCLSAAYGQRQTGNLDGRIVDTSNVPLPGAAITISSPAMMGTHSYMSTEAGLFRFPGTSAGRVRLDL